ncbi:MAG: hypothetical protein RLY35_1528 [Bacteroidota bacterium]
MFNYSKRLKGRELPFILIPLFIFIVCSRWELIYTNDSFQYLKMAYLFSNGQLPLTDKWMPLYSIFIGLVHIITKLSLLQSAYIVNVIFFVLTLALLSQMIKSIHTTTYAFFILACCLIPLNKYFITSSLTIMGELPMLFWTLLFIIQFNKTILDQNWSVGNITLLSFIILCSIFTKYNGLILFVMMILGILVYDNASNKYFKALLSSLIILTPYVIWSRLKSKEDVILTAMAKNSFIDNVFINLQDLFKTLIEFLFNENIYMKINARIPSHYQIVLMAVILIIISIKLFQEFKNKVNSIGLILLGFSLFYITSLLILLSTAGVNEMNTRTLLYPLIALIIYLFTLIKRENSRTVIRCTTISFIIMIAFFNGSKLIDNTRKLYISGSGSLNQDFCKNQNQTLDFIKEYMYQHQLSPQQIHTNENKLLPIYLDYSIMVPLPTNSTWKGNYQIDKSKEEIDREVELLSEQISRENHIICFLGKQHKIIFPLHYEKHFTDSTQFKIYQFIDGFVITSKDH